MSMGSAILGFVAGSVAVLLLPGGQRVGTGPCNGYGMWRKQARVSSLEKIPQRPTGVLDHLPRRVWLSLDGSRESCL